MLKLTPKEEIKEANKHLQHMEKLDHIITPFNPIKDFIKIFMIIVILFIIGLLA